MATYELNASSPRNSTDYNPVSGTRTDVNILKVTDDKSGSVLNVGDTVTVTWLKSSGMEDTFSAKFVGTMTVDGKVFMVLEDDSSGNTLYTVVGLPQSDAPSTIVTTGNSANVVAESFTVCFFPGTLVATPSGERKVEELVPGDLVLIGDSGANPATWVSRMGRNFRQRLGFARAVPVKWIGRQTVSTLFGPAGRLMPVKFGVIRKFCGFGVKSGLNS